MKPLRFGIRIAAIEPPEDFVESVKLAEELGFDSIWIPDSRLHFDLYVSLALAALNTTKVRLGSAVTNPYTRHPGMTAVGIASVDQLSGGRAALGLGAGGMVLELLEIERRQPVAACRQAVEQIRHHLGSHSSTKANGYVPLDLPTRADLPIFIAGTRQKMLALAGEIGDGVIVNVGAHQACIETAFSTVEKGAGRANRDPESLEKLCWLQATAVSEEAAEAVNLVKPTAALMLRHLPPWMIEAMQLEEENIREIHRAFQAEGAKAAARVVSDDMIERFTVSGTPERAVEEIKRLGKQGFDEIIFVAVEIEGNVRPVMTALAEKVVAKLRTD